MGDQREPESPEVLHIHEARLSNIAYVRALWRAFSKGGVTAMAPLVPPDARWRPLGSSRVLNGIHELIEYWDGRVSDLPKLTMFHGHGDDVLVEAEYEDEDGNIWLTVWLLYRFDGDRLVEAIAFPDEASARAYEPPSSG